MTISTMMMSNRLCVAVVVVVCGLLGMSAQAKLTVRGTELLRDGLPTFMSGANQAWVNYGNDFGNNQGQNSLPHYVDTYKAVAGATGNVVRLWVHCGCDQTPAFDPDTPGKVIGQDNGAGTLISDLVANAKAAHQLGITLIISLFNGAVEMPTNLKALVTSASNTQSYVNVVLTPMVKAVEATGAEIIWEVGNEFEGSVVAGQSALEPCQDTKTLTNTGAGWAKSGIHMKDFQQFVGLIASGVHQASSGALVTLGSWSQYASTNAFPGMFDYWTQECLQKAGGDSYAFLDIRQMHSYAYNGKWSPYTPFMQQAPDFKLNKPLMVGEFSATGPTSTGSPPGYNITVLYNHLCHEGYVGGLAWAVSGGSESDSLEMMEVGMRSVCTGAPNPAPPACTDVPPPPGTYTCAQQKSWGKCSASFMKGYCCRTCFDCALSCLEG